MGNFGDEIKRAIFLNDLFDNLNGLSFGEGARMLRNAMPSLKEQMFIDGTVCDFYFHFDADDYFCYTTTAEMVEDDAPNIDLYGGYWNLMYEGNHKTHTMTKKEV